jgi:hypothetical protein
MIQRIQTIHLLLAAVFTGLLLRVPFVTAHSVKAHFYANAQGYFSVDNQTVPVYSTPYLLILTGIILITILATIFAYSSRKTQIRLSVASIVLTGLLFSLLVNVRRTIGHELPQTPAITSEYSIGLALPVLSILFLTLAIRAIRKDEKLVKSVDRLR